MTEAQKHTNDAPTILLNETTDEIGASSITEETEDNNDNMKRQAIELAENMDENELAERIDNTKSAEMTMAEKRLKRIIKSERRSVMFHINLFYS